MEDYEEEEILFRKNNSDCYIPKDFSIVYQKYSNTPEFLRRWCVYKENKRQRMEYECVMCGIEVKNIYPEKHEKVYCTSCFKELIKRKNK